MIRTLLIDNYDSFTYNLYHLIATVNGCPPVVIKNDDRNWKPEMVYCFDNVVISPGPGRPENQADFGICPDVIAQKEIPVLGICLGHQGICQFYGSRIDLATEARHGRKSFVTHDGSDIFRNIPSPFSVIRYHSLAVYDIPDSLDITARAEDGTVMGIRHRSFPQWGVQFHPESICTEYGLQIFKNFKKLTEAHQNEKGKVLDVLPSAFKPAQVQTTKTQNRESLLLLHKKLALDIDSETTFEKCFKNSEYAIWLDSSRQDYGSGRFSYLCKPDGALGRTVSVDVHSHSIHVTDKNGILETKGNFFDWLENDLNRFEIESPELPFEFRLGWLGYIGYEMKGDCEAENLHRSPYPDTIMVFCDRGMVIDHQEKQIHLLALTRHDDQAESKKWIEDASRYLSGTERTRQKKSGHLPESLSLETPFVLRHDREKYIGLIKKSQEYIRQGETYEVCLTNMATARSSADPWITYRMLRRSSPTPYSAYLQLKDICILSCSPERFLVISDDRIAESKPIKGTRGRSDNPAEDRQLYEELAASEKENAENLMIVDLVRHDLGKTAELNSVEVTKLFAIESYKTVHQMVSTIRSKIRPDTSPCQCIRDAFPGGSMTGAPKLRTIQILEGLEEGARGIYSGAIGYFSLSGAVDLSIVIRTLVMSHGKLSFGVGGAITALSDPEEEFEEIRVKAKAFLDLFNTDFPGHQDNAIVSHAETVYQYSVEKKLLITSEPEPKLLVADSWLVDEGSSRALHLHRQRFFSSCMELAGISPEVLNEFWNTAIKKLPKTGLWFPRIELAGNSSSPVFQIRIRPAPAIQSTIRLIDFKGEDFRKQPRHKGPDLVKLISERKKIVEQGSEEAILTTPKGFLLEGLTTSILWWEGSTLCTTPPSQHLLPGVTSQLLRLIAKEANIPFAFRLRKPDELNGLEVWAVNALHGIRRVVDWEKSPFSTSSHIDIDFWRHKLDAFIKPI